MFVEAVADNFGEKIEQKIFHAQIVLDTEKAAKETKNCKPIPPIRSFTAKNGEDTINKEIHENYRQIKLNVSMIIAAELSRIENDSELKHLIRWTKSRIIIIVTLSIDQILLIRIRYVIFLNSKEQYRIIPYKFTAT